MQKNADERYQTVKDLLLDLKHLKRELEFSDELERSHIPAFAKSANVGAVNQSSENATIMQPAVSTQNNISQQPSSAEYVFGEVRKHKFVWLGALAILLLGAIGLGYWFFASRSASATQITSIAVMPFVNESGNAEVEYLSDGMTETLISSLSQLPKLNVKARSSVFRYKGKDTNAQTIGKELNVQAILNGRVVQRGNDLTLYIELVDANTENTLWKADYNRPMSNLITLQSEIASDVSQKLQARISNVEARKIAKSYTANAEAYQLYLKGRFYWNRRTAENIKKAIEQFRAATEKDPNYALAYVGLADSYIALGNYADASTNETLPQAKAYAMRAVELDDSLAEVHTSLGNINVHSWNWAEAEREYKRAIELNPNYPTAHQWYSLWLTFNGRLDEALTEIKHAYDLDPLSPIINANLARTYLLKGELDTAAEQCRKFIEFDPAQPQAYLILAFIRQKQLRHSEAIAEAEKAVELSQRASDKLAALGYFYAAAGKRAQALEILRELKEKYDSRKSKAAYIAWVYAGLGDNDEAFAWLEKGVRDRDGFLAQYVTLFTALDSLRSDPRYAELLRRIGLSHAVK
ncbi:MAG: tetratricopeptide repeat protein [Acidobacteria bacterium]|nr:tetratricopeptide repeat protein [Acidobacteriota bacterium]